MKVGVAILQENMTFQEVENMTVHAETLGYDSVWLADHLYFTSIKKPFLECLTTLTALAMKTESIRLGTLVLCNVFRHPSIVAKAVATLDVISKGRINLGLGAGWHEKEFKQYDLPFLSYEKRVESLETSIKIMQKVWKETKPEPLQHPIPLWIGGFGKPVLRLVAKYADGCNFSRFDIDSEMCRQKLLYLQEQCKLERTDYSQIDKSIHLTYRKMASSPLGMVLTKKRIRQAFNNPHLAMKFISQRVVGSSTPKRVLSVDREKCLNQLGAFKDAGITYFMVEFLNNDDLIKFGWEILPEIGKW